MTNIEHLFASGLDFNHLFVLENINNLPEINRITGYCNILKAKGFIEEDGVISAKGQEIVSLFKKKEENITNNEMLNIVDKNPEKCKTSLTFSQFTAELHNKLQTKLTELTGKKNVNLSFDGKGTSYPYLCSLVDLEGKLKKFINRYKYDDLKRIEHLLLKHCEVRNQKIMRYILREKPETGSDMALDYENYVEETPVESKIIKRKDYF